MQADEFRRQIDELKRKMNAVKPATPPEVPAEPQVKSEDGANPPPADSAPIHKRHKSSAKDSKFREAVLKLVKRQLDAELKRGSITQEEYKDIAKRATNKVMTKKRDESVRCTPAC